MKKVSRYIPSVTSEVPVDPRYSQETTVVVYNERYSRDTHTDTVGLEMTRERKKE